MKRSSLGLLFAVIMSVNAAASAHAQDNQMPPVEQSQYYAVENSNAQPQLEAWASLLFLQPSSGNLEYATLVSPLPLPTPNWANQSVGPDLTGAFNVGVRYIVPESTHDFQLAWTHLNANAHASVVAGSDQFVGPAYEIGPDASLFQIARGSVDFQYDSVNFDVGTPLTSCGPAQVRVFGGLQYAHISQNLSANFQSEDGFFANGNTTDSLFNGVGPRLGMKINCAEGNLDFVGEMAGSALIGRSESRIDFTAPSPELVGLSIPPPNRQSLTSPDATQVVPSLDAKLGAAYSVPGRYGLFRIEAGYQAAVYIDAINQYALSEVVTPPVAQSVGVFLRTAEHLQTNFTVHGPYVTADWVF